MVEEIKTSETGKVDDNTQDYLSALQEMKQKSVDRDLYDKVLADNKKLINAVVNGQTVSQDVEVDDATRQKKVKELRAKLFSSDREFSNLEFVETSIELRDNLIELGEPDPFIPIGKQISPTRDDIEKAELVAKTYKECLELAEGDSQFFTNELMRRTKDDIFPVRKK